jgi:hypothetical protein
MSTNNVGKTEIMVFGKVGLVRPRTAKSREELQMLGNNNPAACGTAFIMHIKE